MKIVVKSSKHTSLGRTTCQLCKKKFRNGERLLYKQSAGYHSPAIGIHMTCLRDTLSGEPEFADQELLQKQYDDYRSLLLVKYSSAE